MITLILIVIVIAVIMLAFDFASIYLAPAAVSSGTSM